MKQAKLMVSEGLLKHATSTGNALFLLAKHVKSGDMAAAQQVFDELSSPNIISWTSLIAGYVKNGHNIAAFDRFRRILHEAGLPNSVTLSCLLRACGHMMQLEKGKEIHTEVISRQSEMLLERDVVLGTSLIDMYCRCGELEHAQRVFDQLSHHDVASWNALISGYSSHEARYGEKALDCFHQVQCQGLTPDTITFVCTLKACGSIGAFGKGREIHSEISRQGLLGRNAILGNALVDMYAKCGKLAEAEQVFDELPLRNVVSWNVLVSGYSQHGHEEKALDCIERMQCEGVSPESVTFLSISKACGNLGAAEKGSEIHAKILREGLLHNNYMLGTALVDMYAKCGALAKASKVFEELPLRNVVSWTTLIAGYGRIGDHTMVFGLFKQMTREGIEPNLVTFTVLLNACSFAGLIDEGQTYFETMSTSYGIVPTLQHHTCMVDLLGRVGHFDEAMALIKKMPSFDHLPTWYALLGSCKASGNIRLGRFAFENAIKLDERSAGAYVCISDMYAAMMGYL